MLAREIADNIEGHKRLESKFDYNQNSGWDYEQSIAAIKQDTKLSAKRISLESKITQLASDRNQLAELEKTLGPDTVAGAISDLEEQEKQLDEENSAIAQEEIKLGEFVQKQEDFHEQAKKRLAKPRNRKEGETGSIQARDIETFSVESVLQTHGMELSEGKVEEFKKLALEELKTREQAKEIKFQAEIRQERFSRESQQLEKTFSKFEKDFESIQDRAVIILREIDPKADSASKFIRSFEGQVAPLKKELYKEKGFFQSQKSKEQNDAKIKEKLKDIKKQMCSNPDVAFFLQEPYIGNTYDIKDADKFYRGGAYEIGKKISTDLPNRDKFLKRLGKLGEMAQMVGYYAGSEPSPKGKVSEEWSKQEKIIKSLIDQVLINNI